MDNIILSLLAKIDLLNALILDATEIDLTPTNDCSSTSDIVRVTNINVIRANDVIYFLIKYPLAKLVYKKLMIRPVYHNVKMLQLEETTIAKCNHYKLTVRNCNTMQPTFCMALLTSSCALQFISGNTAICSTSFNTQRIVDGTHNMSLSIIFVICGVVALVIPENRILKKPQFSAMTKSVWVAIIQTMSKPEDGLSK